MTGGPTDLRCAERGGVRIRFHEQGEGAPPVLFLHGWGCDHRFFRPQFEHFAQRHRVVSPDQRGFGRSDKPEGEYSIEGLADDAAWLCEELGVEGPVVVGHSMGGAVALALAARHPTLPVAVALCDPAVFLRGWAKNLRSEILEGLASPHYREATALLVEQNLFLRSDDPERRGWIVETMCETPQHVLLATLRAVFDFDAGAAARASGVPLLWIASGGPLGQTEALREARPDVEVTVTPAVGHFNPLLAPDETNALLTDFVSRVAPAAHARIG